MTDTPVSPSEGKPGMPPQEQIDEFFASLEAKNELEGWHRMQAQVPPILQEAFLEKYPPPPAYSAQPVDMEDVRQAESKRGTPAPNEPKEYVNAMGETIDPTKMAEPTAAAAPAAAPPLTPAPEPAPVGEPAV